ncbi:MAG: DUF2088 domain-containing protein [Verrucomicrobiae bacterium]|nr:DUF2088 domain-containing protein [Verrucomicrobiae bacterium]
MNLDLSQIQMTPVRQCFPESPEIDIETTVAEQVSPLFATLKPGASVAVGVGSRGITHHGRIVKAVIEQLLRAGAKPFITPAMGSHGGGTPEGQTQVLADFGISEEAFGVPIRADMAASVIGRTASGYDIWFSDVAKSADHVFVINRIKPHTDFSGNLGSGCLKMLTIGLGKRDGAANYHQTSVRDGFEKALREIGSAILQQLPVLGGLAIVEDQRHQPAAFELIERATWIEQEERLFQKATALMPKIPFTDIDLLIVDRIGKNISGTGFDTNVIGRSVHGYSTLMGREQTPPPHIKRLYVRDLTPETHGNAIGVGKADFVHRRLVEQIDRKATYLNALTSLTPHSAKIPITCDTDEEAIQLALVSAGVKDTAQARIVRIKDTLNLTTVSASEPFLPDSHPMLEFRRNESRPLVDSLADSL